MRGVVVGTIAGRVGRVGRVGRIVPIGRIVGNCVTAGVGVNRMMIVGLGVTPPTGVRVGMRIVGNGLGVRAGLVAVALSDGRAEGEAEGLGDSDGWADAEARGDIEAGARKKSTSTVVELLVLMMNRDVAGLNVLHWRKYVVCQAPLRS